MSISSRSISALVNREGVGVGLLTTYVTTYYVFMEHCSQRGLLFDYDPTLEKHLPRLLAVVVMQDLDRMIDIIVRSSSSTP